MGAAAKVRMLLAAAAVVWAAALFCAPAWLFPVGQFICHQRPERSFFFSGHQLPVCARCTGLYIGAALAAPVAAAFGVALASSRARRLLLGAALPTALTWSLEFGGLLHFGNWTRFAAALPLGFAAAWLVLSTFPEPTHSRIEPVRP